MKDVFEFRYTGVAFNVKKKFKIFVKGAKKSVWL